MSVQEQPVPYSIPDQKPSSSIVGNRGDEKYDPFANEDDRRENEQLTETKHEPSETIWINNGYVLLALSSHLFIVAHACDSAQNCVPSSHRA